jgi:hypothetical protein
MLKACWMLLASTPTMKRAVPLRTSTDTFTMLIAFIVLISTTFTQRTKPPRFPRLEGYPALEPTHRNEKYLLGSGSKLLPLQITSISHLPITPQRWLPEQAQDATQGGADTTQFERGLAISFFLLGQRAPLRFPDLFLAALLAPIIMGSYIGSMLFFSFESAGVLPSE